MSTVDKEAALNLCCEAWKLGISPDNMMKGFQTSGLFPLNWIQMLKRIDLFRKGGKLLLMLTLTLDIKHFDITIFIIYLGVAKSKIVLATWLKEQNAAREEVLVLPTQLTRTKKRKTVDVAGRVLKISLLDEIDASKEDAKASSLKKKKALQERKRRRCDDTRKDKDQMKSKSKKNTGNAPEANSFQHLLAQDGSLLDVIAI